VVSVVSGQEIRTVAPQGDAAWPRWSADGQWIYFTTVLRDQFGPIGIAISRVHADGSGLQQIGPMFGGATPNGVGISPNGVGISPDGQTVVIQDGTTLALVDVNSGAVRRLPISCSVPQFSPDGGRIACVTDTTVRIVNADGSDERVVATRPVHTEGGVDWSSDGAWLLISGLLAPELVSVVDGSAVTLTTLRDPLPTQASFVP
jgi:Tol biopolymer transport system component